MDDDTLHFPEAALALLQGFDPELPYFITGAMGNPRLSVKWPTSLGSQAKPGIVVGASTSAWLRA